MIGAKGPPHAQVNGRTEGESHEQLQQLPCPYPAGQFERDSPGGRISDKGTSGAGGRIHAEFLVVIGADQCGR